MTNYLLLACILFCLKVSESKLINLSTAVDLTWPFDTNTVYWNNSQPFVFTKKLTEIRPDGNWYSSNEFCAGEHGGTHFDAPYHFNKHGWKVGDVPLSRLIANGITIDLTSETNILKDKTRLLPTHLQLWESINGPIPNNCVILVKFGWSQYYHVKEKYLGIDENGNYNFPGISKDAAEWIVSSGKVFGVGLDTASIDPGAEPAFLTHKILSENQIYGLENVNIPLTFPEKGYKLYVLPMQIREGTGAPLRLVASPFENCNSSAAVPWYGHVVFIFSSIILLLLLIL